MININPFSEKEIDSLQWNFPDGPRCENVERDRKIVKMRLIERRTLAAIGKEVSLTKEVIRQKCAKWEERLREALKDAS